MQKKLTKRGMEAHTLVSILITLMGFFVLAYILGTSNYSIEQELSMTRASLLSAEKFKLNIAGVQTFRPDLYLRTHSIKIPEKKYSSSKLDVMRNMADRIVDCWWEFGNGQISENVFGKMSLLATHDRCFVCFISTIEKLDKEFSFSDLLKFMAETPYKAKAKKFEYCKEPGNPPGCKSRDESECKVKGGSCASSMVSVNNLESPSQICKTNGYYPFSEWSCKKSDDLCCVKREQMQTYLEYIDNGKGAIYMPYSMVPEYTPKDKKGNLIDESIIRKDGGYAITFKDLTSGNLGTIGGSAVLMVTGAKLGAMIGSAGGPMGIVIGAAVGFLASNVIELFEDSPPQGILITPYPNKEWGNCAIIDES